MTDRAATPFSLPSLALLAALALPASPASATTYVDVFGGVSSTQTENDATRINVYYVDDDSTLEDFDIWYSSTTNRTMTFGVWEKDPNWNDWYLVWSGTRSVTATGYGNNQWISAPSMSVALQGGTYYAIGFWCEHQVHVGFSSSNTTMQDPAWGDAEGYVFWDTHEAWPGDLDFSLNDVNTGGWGQQIEMNVVFDNDNDGFNTDYDCNDNSNTVYPGAPQLCNGVDDDCNGLVPTNENNNDSDGFLVCEGDCNDNDNSVWPGAPEQCDGVDDNCNGSVDEGLTFDVDNDCSGSPDCADDDDDDGGNARSGGCRGSLSAGLDDQGPGALALLALLGLGAVSRRRGGSALG